MPDCDDFVWLLARNVWLLPYMAAQAILARLSILRLEIVAAAVHDVSGVEFGDFVTALDTFFLRLLAFSSIHLGPQFFLRPPPTPSLQWTVVVPFPRQVCCSEVTRKCESLWTLTTYHKNALAPSHLIQLYSSAAITERVHSVEATATMRSCRRGSKPPTCSSAIRHLHVFCTKMQCRLKG